MLATVVFFALIAALLIFLTFYSDEFTLFVRKRLHRSTPDIFYRHPYYHKILCRNLPYYKNLSLNGKKKFAMRVHQFMQSKKFIGMEGLKITEEIKIMISASAIQLTFGFEKFTLDFFTIIKVYPHYFYSKFLNAELKGGASESGIIMLSWKDFLDGYANPEDNYNLGLHEMAHVLKINVIKGSEFDDKFSFYLDEWMKIGSREFERLAHKNSSYLRGYGGRNMHEFFAVCVEHFFEGPSAFKEKLPDIYNHLCFLLNQNPLNPTEDYNLTRDFILDINENKERIPIPGKIKKHYKYHSWHWTYSLMLYGIFGGAVSIGFLTSLTIIPVTNLLALGFTAIAIALTIQYRYFIINRIFTPMDMGFYVIFGIAPATCSLYLILNFLLRTGYSTEYIHIKDVRIMTETVYFQLENEAYSDYTWVRSMKRNKYENLENKEQVLALRFANGVFGYKVFLGNRLYDEIPSTQ